MVAVSDLGKVITADGSQLWDSRSSLSLSLLLLKHKHKPAGALSSYLVPSTTTVVIAVAPVASSTTTVVIAVASTTCETRGDKNFSIK